MFENIISHLGEKKYRKEQFENAVFRELVENTDQITVFPKELREELKNEELFLLKPVKTQISSNKKTSKVLLESKDGHKIESVLMRHEGRNTVCVSTQVGCACACAFCATGQLGLKRNLEAQEIIEQIVFWARELKKEYIKEGKGEWNPKNPPQSHRVRNVVFMGMGEPLLNYDNVIEAIHVMNDDKKLGIGARRITISTVGIIPQIKKLADLGMQINLAVSLHAPTTELRDRIIPMNKNYPLAELMPVLWGFSDKTLRRIFFEYTVIRDINDSDENAHQLGRLLKGRLAHVNFIPLNENPDLQEKFHRPQMQQIRKMQKILEKYGVVSTVRSEFGDEIAGACGQLAGEKH